MPEPGQGPYWPLIVGDNWPQRQWEHLASSVRSAADSFDHGPAEQACHRFDDAVVSSRALESIRTAMDTRTADLRDLGGALYALNAMLDDFVAITARAQHKILDLYEEAVHRIDAVTTRGRSPASGRESGDERADVDAIVDEIREQVRRVALGSASAVADAARPHAAQFDNLLRRWSSHSTAPGANGAGASAAGHGGAAGQDGAGAPGIAAGQDGAGVPDHAGGQADVAVPGGAAGQDGAGMPNVAAAPDGSGAPGDGAALGDSTAAGPGAVPGSGAGAETFGATTAPAEVAAPGDAVTPVESTLPSAGDLAAAGTAAGPGATASGGSAGMAGMSGLESMATSALAGLGAAGGGMATTRRERVPGGLAGGGVTPGVTGFDGIVGFDAIEPLDGPDLVGGAAVAPEAIGAQVFTPINNAAKPSPDAEPKPAKRGDDPAAGRGGDRGSGSGPDGRGITTGDRSEARRRTAERTPAADRPDVDTGGRRTGSPHTGDRTAARKGGGRVSADERPGSGSSREAAQQSAADETPQTTADRTKSRAGTTADHDSAESPVTPWTRPITVEPRVGTGRRRAMPEQWAPTPTRPHTTAPRTAPPRPSAERPDRDLSSVGAESDRKVPPP
ncbi:hypothetical protein [Nocardia sp. alder85J]|uniref:hypothetical protein n=1 Tax=Nocardia sp. alder85J TaxID=2862949 RepID=UPI001CD71724|nr:hypothetical protein [Nocardia sp. alder85J]MCX4091137.1 hypothetical protein [Nocardia sp. alder85J]